MPVTVTVATYEGQPAVRIEGAGVQLKDDTNYGFDNPVSYTVGASTIQVGDEYNVTCARTIPVVTPMIPTVRVASASELLIVGADGGHMGGSGIGVLYSSQSGRRHA